MRPVARPGPVACATLAALGAFAGAGGCSSGGESAAPPPPAAPDRRDYFAFRARHPEVIDPNYLPFMVHRARTDDPPGELQFLCRWDDADMPLRVYVEPPAIPDSLQDEFRPAEPGEYARAVGRALGRWEKELEGRVRFERTDDPAEALLVLRIRGEPAPVPEEGVQVLGMTESLREACRVEGPLEAHGVAPLAVRFRVPELDLYVADQAGLLSPWQVEQVALHEIGHALGMKGHSPMATDFMYAVARDQPAVKSLSMDDVNSFVSLYSVPNGTRYAFVPDAGRPPRPEPGPPTRLPLLALAPHVDARLGFEIETPEGWMRVPTERGFFAANGPVWDRDASIEIAIWPYPDLESFFRRFGSMLFAGTRLLDDADVIVAGRPALWMVVHDRGDAREHEFLFIELGDGRVMMVLTDCPSAYADAWRPWFRAIWATLEIWDPPGGP